MFKNFTNKIFPSLTLSLFGFDKNRLISIAVRDGIRFWNYEYKNDCIYVDISTGDYKILMNYESKTNTEITVLRKNGFLFKIEPFIKRKGLILGFIFSLSLYIYLSSCYWIIDVGTEGIYTDAEILEFASENGLHIGTPKSTLDEEALSILIMMEFDELKWVSVNTLGCTVTIDLEYSDLKPEIHTADDVSNVVASKAGIIRYIEATFGRISVEIGTAVSPGDILITGTWDENYDKDEWSLVEDPTEFSTASRGIVLAETQNIITVYTPKIITEYEEIQSYKRFTLGLFSLKIPFCFNLVPSGNYSYILNENYLTLLGVSVPIYWNTEILTELSTLETVQNEYNAMVLLDELVCEKASSMLDEGEELLEILSKQYFEDENYYYLTCNCIFLEDIALVEVFLDK